MSKHEPNAKLLKEQFLTLGWKASWTRRKNTIYMTLALADEGATGDVFATKTRSMVRSFYPEASLTSGGYGGGTFKVRELPPEIKPAPFAVPFSRVDNSLKLDTHDRITEKERASLRANALFIHSKLCLAGVSAAEAKAAIEKLYNDALEQGWNNGYDTASLDNI